MKKGKRLLVLLILFMTMLLLVGCGSKSVELMDKDLLIDLNAAIKNADLGKERSNATLQEEVEQENQSKPEVKVQNKETEAKEIYQVTVQWETIKFEDIECKDIEELKKFIAQHCSRESELSLQDDDAEAHVYQEVLDEIEDMQREIGFSFLQNNT